MRRKANRWLLLSGVLGLLLMVSACLWPVPSLKTDNEVERSPSLDITYTISTENAKDNWDDPIAKELTKRTGVSLRYAAILGDPSEKLAVWLASGDYPDLIQLQAQDLANYGKAGAVYELSDLIEKYAPNIMKSFGANIDLLKDPYGDIYGITAPPTLNNDNASVRGYFHIQYDVLRQFGYPKIATLDQYAQLISKYIKKNKFINGNRSLAFSTIGSGESLFASFSDISMAYMGEPKNGPFVVDSQNNVHFAHFQPEYPDLYKFLNRLNRDGLFDGESFIQNQEAFTQKCSQGNIIATIAPPESIDACNAALVRNGMPQRQFASFEIVMPGRETHVQDYALTGGKQYLAISTNVKDPVRAIKFIDSMFKLDNQILLGWGIQDQYFELKNGKRTLKPDFLAKLQENGPEAMGLTHGIGLLAPRDGNDLSDGQPSNLLWTSEYIRGGYDPVTKDVLDRYGVRQWSDLVTPGKPLPNLLSRIPTEAAEDRAMKQIVDLHNRILPELIAAEDDGKFNEIWRQYLDSASRLGVGLVESDRTAKWQRYLNTFKP